MNPECISIFNFRDMGIMRISVVILGFALIQRVSASFSLSLLRTPSTLPPQSAQGSLSLDSISRDTFQAPVIQDYKVEPITSEDVPLLEELSQQAATKKRKDSYTSLSEDDLKITVKMESIESPLRYLVTPPPSTCDGATGPAAKLLDCVTTFPRVQIYGYDNNT